MELLPTAHVDTFCRDWLPPADQWPDLRFDLPELAYPDRLNCAEVLLDATIARYGAHRRCLVSPSGQWTYAEVLRRAGAIAQVLVEDFGLVPGNRVLLRGPNNPWLAACWLGVIRAGGVAVPTMPLLRAGELATVCDIARIDLACCDARFTADLAAAGVPGLRLIAYGGDRPDDLVQRCAAKSGEFTPVRTAADDVAMLAFTSGTTGRPKATMQLHREIVAVADTFGRYLLESTSDDLFTGSPPLAFTYGLGSLLIFPLRVGAASLLLERATPDVLPGAIAEHGATVLSTSPTGYRMMLAAGQAPQLASLRCCVSAGEPLPRSVWEAFHRATGLRIIDGIGSTEMLHIFISAAGDDIRPGSTGRPVPGYQAAVLDDAGQPVPDGTIGRLAVKGPTGCCYLADERQRTYVRDGWNLTGDTYLRDADGYYWYQARSDDMIISAGYNIAGPEVEEALLAHPDVADCGVVGAPDPNRGMIVAAYVVLRGGVPADPAARAAALQDFVKQRIAPYKYPRSVTFVEALPRTNTGKLQRYRLRDQARAASAPSAPAASAVPMEPADSAPAAAGSAAPAQPDAPAPSAPH
ncbi:MAG: 2-aminobenzoate-CoA ligase [Mycobacteriales bacterium]